MILFELAGRNEDHPVYASLAASSLERQYHFLDSVIGIALQSGWIKVSSGLIKALNHHAIACLHVHAGQYRPCEFRVGDYEPPEHYRVPELMNEMINDLNRHWDSTHPLVLGAYALWRLNWIHPFINGNGRTARALCYYIICLKLGGFLPSNQQPLPILIRANRMAYIGALQESTRRFATNRRDFLLPVVAFLQQILRQPSL